MNGQTRPSSRARRWCTFDSGAAVQETAIRRHGCRLPSKPPSPSCWSRGFTERTASAAEQILATLLFAGMPGSEKNRCVFRGARRGTFGGVQRPVL